LVGLEAGAPVAFVGASSILARLEANPLSLTGGRVFCVFGQPFEMF